MIDGKEIKVVSEKKAEDLYNSLTFCAYCDTSFKDCDTIIAGKGLMLGGMDVVGYKGHFWHYGCVFDHRKDNKIVK